MPPNLILRNALTVQGLFYLATNLWALTATRHFLSYTNPQSDIFEARSFAALSTVLAIYFLAGAWRRDLLRPAAFLGLGSAVAIILVELFHLPEIGLRTLLWLDFLIEIALAGVYIMVFFFRRDQEEQKKEPSEEQKDQLVTADEKPTVSQEGPEDLDIKDPMIAEETEEPPLMRGEM